MVFSDGSELGFSDKAAVDETKCNGNGAANIAASASSGLAPVAAGAGAGIAIIAIVALVLVVLARRRRNKTKPQPEDGVSLISAAVPEGDVPESAIRVHDCIHDGGSRIVYAGELKA